eukprot:1191757-Pyramimonas_sp.AAC.1
MAAREAQRMAQGGDGVALQTVGQQPQNPGKASQLPGGKRNATGTAGAEVRGNERGAGRGRAPREGGLGERMGEKKAEDERSN